MHKNKYEKYIKKMLLLQTGGNVLEKFDTFISYMISIDQKDVMQVHAAKELFCQNPTLFIEIGTHIEAIEDILHDDPGVSTSDFPNFMQHGRVKVSTLISRGFSPEILDLFRTIPELNLASHNDGIEIRFKNSDIANYLTYSCNPDNDEYTAFMIFKILLSVMKSMIFYYNEYI